MFCIHSTVRTKTFPGTVWMLIEDSTPWTMLADRVLESLVKQGSWVLLPIKHHVIAIKQTNGVAIAYCQTFIVVKSARLLLKPAPDDVKMGAAALWVFINGRLSARLFIVKLIATVAATLLAACQSGLWIDGKLDLITSNLRRRPSMKLAARRL